MELHIKEIDMDDPHLTRLLLGLAIGAFVLILAFLSGKE